MLKKYIICFFLVFYASFSAAAQTHTAVPLDNPVYKVLEQAQLRGLCGVLPGVKPYSKAFIISVIDEILENRKNKRFGALNDIEAEILEQFKRDFTPHRDGLNITRGTYSAEHVWNDIYFSSEFGLGISAVFAAGYYPVAGGYQDENGASHPASGDFYFDYGIYIPAISFLGDLGKNASYGLTLTGFIGSSPRAKLGEYNYNIDYPEQIISVYSEPLAYFPYTYKKRWDGFIWPVDDLSSGGMISWPSGISLGYTMMPELTGSLLNDHVLIRFARLDREWAGMLNNGSIVLNGTAQPFLALETVIRPFSWLTFSSLTGVLEYDSGTGESNRADLKSTASSFQNAFSMVLLELSYKNYFRFDLGSNTVWPKRFELGYLHPVTENLLYQNNIGDFDNMGLFTNIQIQYPGIARIWFSLFLDEVNIKEARRFFELDRMMFAYQVGGSLHIPWLPFTSVSVSYTKIEPYNYTHTRIEVPWYTNLMETNYVTFGRSLGHYLPPNSDELLIRFDMMPFKQSMFSLQYQMIRHGADYGDRAVDGSSLWSELPPLGRDWNGKNELKKYFLRDGAYQWSHIVKLRGEYSFTDLKLPFKFFAELGFVNSYFTDIDESIMPNSGEPNEFKVIDTPLYPKSFVFIGIIGIQIFPKF